MIGPRLSALIVARNEEEELAGCLDSVTFADEIVVVLDRCTDGSRAIAERYAKTIIEGAWEVEGPRRMAGIAACTGGWIFEIDADERASPELGAEIRARIADAPPGYFLVPIDNYIGDRLVRYGWGASWGTGAKACLFSRGTKRWGEQHVHPKIELSGQRRRLSTPIAHYVDRDISDMILRLDRYTTARARDLRASGQIGSFSANFRRLFSRFYKCYVRRKGYREGGYGFLIALFAGLFPLLSFLKAKLERE